MNGEFYTASMKSRTFSELPMPLRSLHPGSDEFGLKNLPNINRLDMGGRTMKGLPLMPFDLRTDTPAVLEKHV